MEENDAGENDDDDTPSAVKVGTPPAHELGPQFLADAVHA